MAVLRIVANLATSDPQQLAAFYDRVFGLKTVMDHGWIATAAAESRMRTQLSFAAQGGSDTPVPALSIEVDDVAEAYRAVEQAGSEIVYALTEEPWGVRRFFFRDPVGTLVNVLQHLAQLESE